MVVTLTLPQFNKEKLSTRDMVVSVLSSDSPLTAKKTYNKIVKDFSANLTYQAVFLSLKELSKHGILARNPDGYSINPEWVSKLREFSTSLEEQQVNDSTFAIDGYKTMARVYGTSEFDSLLKYNEYLTSTYAAFTPKLSDSDYILYITPIVWWPVNNISCDAVYQKIRKDRSFTIFGNNNALGKVCISCRQAQGLNARAGVPILENGEIHVLGDTIIQTQFQGDIMKTISEYLDKSKKLERYHSFQFLEILKSNAKIQTRISRNPQLARVITNYALSFFPKQNLQKALPIT